MEDDDKADAIIEHLRAIRSGVWWVFAVLLASAVGGAVWALTQVGGLNDSSIGMVLLT